MPTSKKGDSQEDTVQQEVYREQESKRTIRRDIKEPTNSTQGRGDASSATASVEMEGVSEEDYLPAKHKAESTQVKPQEKRRHEDKEEEHQEGKRRRLGRLSKGKS